MDDLLDLVEAALAEPVEVLKLRISAELVLDLVYDGDGILLASLHCGTAWTLAELGET